MLHGTISSMLTGPVNIVQLTSGNDEIVYPNGDSNMAGLYDGLSGSTTYQ